MNSCEAYRESWVRTLPQEGLVLSLYDGALKFLRQAEAACEQKDFNLTNYFLGRAQDIILELAVTLNPAAGEIAERLRLLYDFMYRTLVEANVKKETALIRGVSRLLKELREAWAQATVTCHSHDYTANPRVDARA